MQFLWPMGFLLSGAILGGGKNQAGPVYPPQKWCTVQIPPPPSPQYIISHPTMGVAPTPRGGTPPPPLWTPK